MLRHCAINSGHTNLMFTINIVKVNQIVKHSHIKFVLEKLNCGRSLKTLFLPQKSVNLSVSLPLKHFTLPSFRIMRARSRV